MPTLTEETVEFTLDFKPERTYTVFDSVAYNKFREEQLPWTRDLPEGSLYNPPKTVIRLGEFKLFNAVLPKFSMQSFFPFGKQSMRRTWLDATPSSNRKIGFSDDILIPVLQDSQNQTWMSFTPSEVITQRSQIKRTKGKTIIAGMGLGWFAHQVLQRKKVTEVVIIDKNKDVLDFFGEILKALHTKPITLVHTSAYDFDWNQPFDVAVWDIWKAFNHAVYDTKYLKIKENIQQAGKVCTQWGRMQRD